MCEFDKLDKTFASDLYLIYKRSSLARVCISDTDQLLMFYLSLIMSTSTFLSKIQEPNNVYKKVALMIYIQTVTFLHYSVS